MIKWIPQTALHTQIWQQIKGLIPWKKQTTATHPIWNGYLNSSITIEIIEVVVLKLPKKFPDGFTENSTIHLKKNEDNLHNTFQKTEKDKLSNSAEASNTWKTKEGQKRKLLTNISHKLRCKNSPQNTSKQNAAM